jgi:hypothetical protein
LNLVALVAAISAPLPAAAQSAAEPQPPWQRISGPAGTGCSDGSTWSFFYRPGATDRLLVWLHGGGACWNGDNCDPQGRPTYSSSVDTRLDGMGRQGILSARPDNPLRGYTAIGIVYCTGDLHLGSRTVEYSRVTPLADGSTTFSVQHIGSINAEAAIEWVLERLDTPSAIFVTGESAGSPPVAIYARKLADRFPNADVVGLGNSGGGFRAPILGSVLRHWGVDNVLERSQPFAGVLDGMASLDDFYLRSGSGATNLRLAQVNVSHDEVVLRFLSLLGRPDADLPALLEASYAEIGASMPGFRTYTAPGTFHVLPLGTDAFFHFVTAGVRLRDWIETLSDGGSLTNVGCPPCTPE